MSESNADFLRRTAQDMREKARAATPGTWRQEFYRDGELLADGTGGFDNYETPGSGVYVIDESSPEGYCLAEFDAGSSRDAAHIAAWHPNLALAVADWLERTAVIGTWGDHVGIGPVNDTVLAALAVASTWWAGEQS